MHVLVLISDTRNSSYAPLIKKNMIMYVRIRVCVCVCVQEELKETAEAVQAVWVGKDVSY